MDYAHNLTDKKLKALENKIAKEYKQAAKTAEKKLQKYLDGFKEQDKEWRKMVSSGEKTKAEYLKWRQSKIGVGQRWKDLKDNLAQDMTNANKIAMSAVREHMPEVYALNHNFGTFEVEEQSLLNTSYALYDRQTVERLFRESPSLLPKPRVDIPKDLRWNRQKIQSALTQGLLLGESMGDIAARMQKVTDMNFTAAIRNARTAVTSAENGGRIDSYKRAEGMGIKMKKQWLSTPDGRTRDSHRDVDGETIGVNETFSNGLDFPGDPGGPPEEVYNCRCTLVGVLDKVDHDSSGRFMRIPKGQSYEEWKSHHKPQRKGKSPAHVIANGADITSTWVRRADQFDFEIEDAINAQGFDGLPRVVSADEFDELAKQANDGNGFVAQRTYSASDKETLDMYQDQLYHGKWYVDCSTGGAQYGQGMYCAADYNGQLTDGIKIEMEHYQVLNKERGNEFAHTETFTLDPSAKIIKYDEIVKMQSREETNETNVVADFLNKNVINNDKLSNEEKSIFFRYFDESALAKVATDEEILKYQKIANDLSDRMEYKQFKQITKDAYAKVGIKKSSDVVEAIEEQTNAIKEMDVGAYATIKGYDAINAEGHGRSGSYTVILNRTKLIIKGE